MAFWEALRRWMGPLAGAEGPADRFGLGPEGRRRLLLLGVAALAGAALLMGGRGLAPAPRPVPPPGAGSGAADPDQRYVQQVTAELEAILGRITGAGQVQVMLTLEQGFRQELARDTTREESQTDERDAQGGTRSTQERRITESVRDSTGSRDVPALTVGREWPRVAGVVVAAQGAGDPAVRRVLAEAVATVLHVPEYRVRVVPAR
ncbi:hypothetical protein [Limnochorda pilosa]|uniref:Stage III sporulation protein AG n=1 Tax=Limnochorda pilosa TaxID=1555112 RepID=A0A0K2SMU0_LIMPI|nr:hypothetical protein [Limnochorda pilosa]BAS28431.1 stage III sporulation protein AG [Limnochorda pilosa]